MALRIRFAVLALLVAVPASPESDVPKATSFAEAKTRATSEGRRIVLLIDTASTAAGAELLADLLTDKKVAELSDKLLVVGSDAYDGDQGTSLARRYNIHYLPTLLLLDADGGEIERLEDVPAAKDLRHILDDFLAQKGPLARLRAAEKPDDPESMLALGRALKSRGDFTGAKTRLTAVAIHDPDHKSPQTAGRALYVLGLLALHSEDVEESRQAFEAVVKSYAGSAAAADSELALAELDGIEGHGKEALLALERFRIAHPQHPQDALARELIEKLRVAP